MKYVWAIDKGHGGIIDGQYVTAPSKMYEHSSSEVFYEGVSNRVIGDLLLDLGRQEDLVMIDICPTELDVPLPVRVKIVNQYYKQYGNLVLLSLHSNAGGGSGFEVWTSVGQTRSDKFAEILGGRLVHSFPDLSFRSDTVDGDLDKESQFYILAKTKCPAVLPECLFFDNYNEYLLLEEGEFRIAYVKVLIDFMKKAELQNI